jgi:hypothetical protein
MYRITPALSVGGFAELEHGEALLGAGVTHVLNVSDAASRLIAAEGGFHEVAWVPLNDSRRLPFNLVAQALDILHRMA